MSITVYHVATVIDTALAAARQNLENVTNGIPTFLALYLALARLQKISCDEFFYQDHLRCS
jgi:hypothetical protein